MKGLELSQLFYQEYGAPMLHAQFPELEDLIAVGLAGSGSECFGYDDTISQDHDFEPGFCLFLPGESVIDRKAAFALERAYAKLPKEFMGYRRCPMNPVGGNRHGVIRMEDFFRDKTGSPDGRLTLRDWFFVPEQALAEAVNGKVYRDVRGEFTAIRQALRYFPEDVRRKKLAGELLTMGQAGQYNYPRCVSRGETAAAQLAMTEFVKSTLHAVFLVNQKYMPYYKWSFRALRALPLLAELHDSLEYLLTSGNSQTEAEKKSQTVEQVCGQIAEVLREQALSQYPGNEAEGHAYAVNGGIADAQIRNLHILYAV